MSRILVTGSVEGLGRAAAEHLLNDGHDVVAHARSPQRAEDLAPFVGRGGRVVVGDLADRDHVANVAEQVNAIGAMDAVIHNAGVIDGADVIPVNVVAPYILTALLTPPGRSIVLSSSMHRGGRADLSRIDWSGKRPSATYSDSKLLATILFAAIAQRAPGRSFNAVDPGWVPTRMGGPHASDDLREGHLTQVWLATSDEPQALTTGGYWHHLEQQEPHPAVRDRGTQHALLRALEETTRMNLPDLTQGAIGG